MSPKSEGPRSDILLSMSRTATEDYMQQIVDRSKTHEFRKRRYPSSVVRVWFYEVAPVSAVTYVCEIDPAHVRGVNHEPLPEDGIGNREYNTHHPDWEGYDFAYRVTGCWRLRHPVPLADMKAKYGIGCAPRGMVYAPDRMLREVRLDEQELIWRETDV